MLNAYYSHSPLMQCVLWNLEFLSVVPSVGSSFLFDSRERIEGGKRLASRHSSIASLSFNNIYHPSRSSKLYSPIHTPPSFTNNPVKPKSVPFKILTPSISASLNSSRSIKPLVNDMNTGVLQDKTSRYEKLAKPKKRVDKNVHQNPYLVKAGALSYQISDNLNKLANPKRRPEAHEPVDSRAPIKTAPAATVRYGSHKLINSDEQSKEAQENRKKKFLIDTYARIVAARNKRTSKRLQDLAKPKSYSARSQPAEEFDDYIQNINKCNVKVAPRLAR